MGDLVWVSDSPDWRTPAAYASPVPTGPPENRTVLFFGPLKLSAVKAATGEVLWSAPFKVPYEVIADPIVLGERVFYSSPYWTRSMKVSEGKFSMPWQVLLRAAVATPVLVNGFLFGHDWAEFVDWKNWDKVRKVTWSYLCVDWSTGAVKWTVPMRLVTTSAAGGKLLVLDLAGTLSIVDASPDGWHECSSADVLQGANKARLFPTPAALSGGRIYCRNYAGDLVCIDTRN